MKAMCAFLGVSRAAYHAWRKNVDQSDADAPRLELVERAFQASHQTYGYRRISLWVRQQEDQVINPKAVLRLMHRLNIRSRARRRKMDWKPENAGVYRRYSNLLNREFAAHRPNQKWVTDVTFIATQQGWAYLSTIKDLYAGFIVAHRLERQHSIGPVTRTLRQARQEEARQALAEYVDFYNYERIQLKTKQTPYQRRCLLR